MGAQLVKTLDMADRTIEDHHATGGSHYFAYIDPNQSGRICIDCGLPEPVR